MRKEYVLMLVSSYLDKLKQNKTTSTVTIKLDLKEGGIGRARASLEHDLKEFLNEKGDVNNLNVK